MGLVSKIQLVIGLQSVQLYIVMGLIRRKNKRDRRRHWSQNRDRKTCSHEETTHFEKPSDDITKEKKEQRSLDWTVGHVMDRAGFMAISGVKAVWTDSVPEI